MPKVTEIQVRESLTHNLGDYSNYRPSIALTIVVEDGDDWREVEQSARKDAIERLQNLVDDELERRGDRPFYDRTDLHGIYSNKGAGYLIAVRDGDDLPHAIDADYGRYYTERSAVRGSTVDAVAQQVSIEEGLTYLGVLTPLDYTLKLPILQKALYSPEAKTVIVTNVGQKAPSQEFGHYRTHRDDLYPDDAHALAEAFAAEHEYVYVGIVADAHYEKMLPKPVRLLIYSARKVALILAMNEGNPTSYHYGYPDTTKDLLIDAAREKIAALGDQWRVYEFPSSDDYPTIFEKAESSSDDYDEDDEDDYDEDDY